MSLNSSASIAVHFDRFDRVSVNAARVDTLSADDIFCVTIGGWPTEIKLFLSRAQLSQLDGQLDNAVAAALNEQHPDAASPTRDTSDPFAPVP